MQVKNVGIPCPKLGLYKNYLLKKACISFFALICLRLVLSCGIDTDANSLEKQYWNIVPYSEPEIPELWLTNQSLPATARLTGFVQQWQTMNNCGPAALSILLSYYGVMKTQDELGIRLRSCKDDPSVLLSQLETEAAANGLYTRMLEGGSVDLLKILVAQGYPVMVKIWIIDNAAMQYGHSCIVSGYKGDDTLLITDSLHGTNAAMQVAKFDAMWRVYNRSLLVLARKGEEASRLDSLVTGTARDFARAAVKTALEEIDTGYPHVSFYAGESDALAIGYFNLGSSYARLEAWDKADEAFTKAFAIGMLPRMLFYFPDYLLPWLLNGKYKRVLAELEPFLRKNPFSEELQWYKHQALFLLKTER